MKGFKKDHLLLDEKDSRVVKNLKEECNKLINKYNLLDDPLSEQEQLLAFHINYYLMKIHKLKELQY